MLEGVARSFAFGATLAAAVGPIAVLILGYGLRGGLRPAVAAGVGAALADFIYALVAFTIGSIVLGRLAQYEHSLQIGSALLLVALGVWLVARALRPRRTSPIGVQARDDLSRPLMTTFTLTMVNPLTMVFFATFAAQLPVRSSGLATAVLASSLFLGSLTIQMLFAAGGATLARYVSRPEWLRAVNVGSGAAIAAFGIAGLLRNLA